MNWTKLAKPLAIAAVVMAVAIALFAQDRVIKSLRRERNRYQHNTEVLLSDVEFYKVHDSLNAAKVKSLELTLKEFQRFRSEDATLIKSLQKKNRDLASVNKTQSETIIALQSIPKDTVIITKDSLITPAVAVHCGDAWYDFDGVLTAEQFTGTLKNRDSLLLAESVRYKRFLGFLWKTRRIKDRQLDCVSMNPHSTILGLEHIVIEK